MNNFNALSIATVIIMTILSMVVSGVARANDSITIIERADSEFLILALDINGFLRSDGIDAYLPDEASPEDVLIPLGALSRALSVSIEVDPAAGTATGFFLNEERIFELDMANRQVISALDTFDLVPDDAEAQADDIYVKASVLSNWFDLDIDLELSSLTLYVDSDSIFPFEESENRQRQAARLLVKSRRNTFDPKNAYLLPYGLYSEPSIVLQQSLTGSKTKNNSTLQSTTNIQAGFDFLKFGADLNLSYSADNQEKSEITNTRLTFSRSDPKREMLNGLKIGRVDIGDINFSSVPLFTGSQRGAGVRISSEADFGFQFSQQLGNILIDGDAPVNWDVELYRNGQFVNFQTVGGDARFKFENVTLISGFNRFKILLFGPEGQKKSFTRDVFSGPNMLADGQVKYDLSAGLPQSDFLPLAKNSRDDKTLGASGEIYYGVNNFLTVGGNFYQGPINDETATSGGLSATASFLGFNSQLQILRADKNRSAYQAAIRRKFLGMNTALTHTIFDGFNEDDQDIKKSTSVSFSRNFGKLNMTLIGETQQYLTQDDRTVLESIISSDLFGLKFTNELIKTISDNKQVDDLKGTFSAFKEIYSTRLRFSLAYDLDSEATDYFRTFRMSAQKKMLNNQALRLSSNYDFASDILSGDVRYSRELGPVTLDFDVGATTDESYSAGLTVRTSLQPRKSGYDFVQPRIGTLANLGVRAFIDENTNEIFDEGEQIIENILFKTARGEVEASTLSDGIGWFYGLAETPTRIYVSQHDIPSIYLVPTKKGIDLIPRRGAKGIVDFPFTQLGEIDGFVFSSTNGEPLTSVPVRAINIKTGQEIDQVKTEYDGFYLFTALPLGEYKIIASQNLFDTKIIDTATKTVTLSAKMPNMVDVNLSIGELIKEATFMGTNLQK